MRATNLPDRPASVVALREGGPRRLTALHPSLAARYTELVAGVASDVEARLSNAVAANRVVRCSLEPPSLRLASWRVERSAFAERLRGLGRIRRHLVFADVRNFYAEITPPVVLASLLALDCDGASASAVATFLRRLTGVGVRGLPVGPQPSAVLANAVLSDVDAALSAAGMEHLRWVDDVVIGATGAEDAVRGLTVLARALSRLGLELNERKTRIVLDAAAIEGTVSVSATGARAGVG